MTVLEAEGRTISVIMPCYNGGRYLKRAVYSALEQHYKNIELIVVNDGSTDNSLEILEAIIDPRLKVISQQNRGVCIARNQGLAVASGEYIAFLDTDDTWHPDCLKRLCGALQAQPEAVLAYCGWQNVGSPSRGRHGKPFVPPDYEIPNKIEALLEGCRWHIGAALARKKIVLEVGGFDERFLTSEDYFLWLRIAAFGKIVRVPEVLSFYHFHDAPQASQDIIRFAYDQWSVKRAFLREHPEIEAQLGKQRIRELTDGKLLELGYMCYWQRDLPVARALFRRVMRLGYGSLHDWKYMLPSLFPAMCHKMLIIQQLKYRELNAERRSETKTG